MLKCLSLINSLFADFCLCHVNDLLNMQKTFLTVYTICEFFKACLTADLKPVNQIICSSSYLGPCQRAKTI